MSIEIPFKRLSDADELLPFDCGDEDLNNYLFSDALSYQNQLLSVTYYLDNGNETILFFSLSNDKIAAIELTNGFWRKIKTLFPHSKHRKDYPAVKIGRLGVNVKYQHQEKSWGAFILNYVKQWMVTENKTGSVLSPWMPISPQFPFISRMASCLWVHKNVYVTKSRKAIPLLCILT